jgi:hypothetical protein
MALEWARVVAEHTGLPVLILAQLAVAQQFVDEGNKLGCSVNLCREGGDVSVGVNVTNYDRLHKFDPSAFGGVVLDESSCLKDYTSATRNALIESFQRTPFRLACTATPAPNDFMELGNHAEFLGAMSRAEMLAMFFTHDGGETQKWRLKGHAQDDFWRWVASWAAVVRKPSDLGYDDGAFELPELRITEHVVECPRVTEGDLFGLEARTLSEQRLARNASLDNRVARTAEIVAAHPEDQWLLWCELNAESAALTAAIDGTEVKGSDSSEHKERTLIGFARGEVNRLVSKSSIAGWGMNFQRCHRVVFVGIGHSFESWYQAIRRTWRFGQQHVVDCHVVISSADGCIAANLKRKQADAEQMAAAMVEHTAAIVRENVRGMIRTTDGYSPGVDMIVPAWVGSEDAA